MHKQVAHNLTLITGGAKSGKTAFAEKLALESRKPVFYLATMPRIAGDAEQEEKILRHRKRRPGEWHTIEAEREIDKAVSELPSGEGVCIIDCLSLYISNLFFQFEHRGGALREQSDPSKKMLHSHTATSRFDSLEESVIESVDALIAAIGKQSDKTFIVVTNEVGFGIVPDNEMARRYRDFLGEANQSLAKVAGIVWLSCSGLQIKLK
jgi:adenosylcobinamide kinase/adenosylcobinamide-phosphate guanylyltransferase